ncbi:MAG: hypothetical protein IKV98_05695, partial [Clostridia bacterium]|nr:hypothetical protein [Clostridia bacterium]
PVEVAEDYTFTMPAGNVTVSATFRVLQSYTITVDEDIENGTITAPESAYEGSTVTLTVTPEVGYALSKLEVMQGDIPVEVTGDHTFVMPQGDVTISAVFKEKRDLIVGEDAEISEGDIPFCTFYEHSLVQYVIPADMLADANGTIFNGITYYYTPASSTTEDVTLTIYLQETTESSPGSNSFTSLEGAQKVYEGTNNLSTDMAALHELPLTFDNGYLYTGGNLLVTVFKSADDFFSRLKFPSISGFSKRALTDDDPYVAENITTYSSTLDGDIPKCKISFTSSTLYDITVDDSIENGTVTANTASSIMGSRITLNIAPAEGYVLDALTVMQGNVPVEVSEDYTFTMPDGNVTISATFRVAQSYAITVDENIENGTITSPESAYEGTTVTLTIEPNNKHVLETLSVMQGDLTVEVSDDYTFVMPSGNVTISATFKEMTELIIGENATQTGGVIPFRMYYKNAVSQYVIPSDMLKLIDGKLITDITYYYTPQSDSSTDITLSVYLSEMDIEDFTAQSFLPITGVQKAYEGTLSDLSTDPDNVHEMLLALDSPYYYNGGDLLVTVFKTADEYVTDFKFQSIEGVANHIYSDHDTYSLESLPNLSCHSSDLIPKTKLGFTDTTTYNITVADGIENGTVTTNVDVSIESGGVFVTVTPDEGYAVDTVSYNDGEEDHVITPENGLYYFEMPASDVTVSATFLALTRYAITVDENIGYGTIEVDESAYERSTVTVEITPDDGCVLLEFSVMQGETAIEVSDDYTFVMPDGDVTITAAFGYPLQIGGVTVTPDNASDIFGDGTAVYDAGENKLALNNYAYNGEPFKVHGDHNYDAVIAYSKTRPFTLVLSGDNSITVTKDTTSITGIFVSGDLTISGTGSLNIEASGESVTHAGAIRVLNGVTVSGVTLDASAGDASTISYGIHCDYDINISDATVKTSGGHAPNSAGLFSAHGKVKITGSAVTAESSDEAASHWAISAYVGIELGGVRIAEPSGAYVRNNSILNYDGTPVSDVSIVLTELFTLAGNLDVFEFDWDPGYSGNDLIWNNKTLKYEKTYENVAAGKYFFKIAKDHTWPGYGAKTEGEYIQNGVALELLKNSGDIGLYLPTDVKTLTFAFDPETLAVTVSWYNSITVGVDENGEPTHYSAAIPFYTFYLYSIAQHMLPAEMINTESGMIEALTWYYYQNDEILNRNIKVYLSEIEEDSVSDFVPVDESALVYEGNVTIEVVSDDYTEAKELYLKLDHPYEYNGKNLLVTVIDESVDDLYSSVAFLGIQNDVTSSTFRYDDFAGFTLDTLKNNMPIDSSSFVPMTKIDFKADAAIFFEGAQIRTSGEQGLRFVFSMAREYYDTLVHPTSGEQTGEGFGSVILPKFLIDGSLTKESEFAGVVPAVKLYEMTDTSVKFTVCLTQISDYEREYSAVPYVTDSAGNTIYGELADGISVYEIAELCYADEKSDATFKEYLLTNILNAVDPEKYPIAE